MIPEIIFPIFLIETVQIRGHNICLYAELIKIIPNDHKKLPLIYCSANLGEI